MRGFKATEVQQGSFSNKCGFKATVVLQGLLVSFIYNMSVSFS